MSVDTNALSMLPGIVNAGNAESGANNALLNWKSLSATWSQETADAVGKSVVNYATQWNASIMPVIEEKIRKFQSEYEEKKSQYEAVKSQCNVADEAITQAQKDMDACKAEKPRATIDSGMISNSDFGGGTAGRKEYVIVDYYGYNLAKQREAQAKAEKSRYEAEMKNWKKQMDSAKSNLSKAEKEKEQESRKIETFIMNVYDLRFMNESVEFLKTLKSSSVEISKQGQNKLFSRLFLIENKYRNQFEKFEEIIKSSSEKYKTTNFESTPEILNYSAKRIVKSKKFKSEILISLISSASDYAKLSFIGEQEFIVAKKKLEAAKENVQTECKNYVLQIDKCNFKIALNAIYENEKILEEIEKINADSDLYAEECEKILETLKNNGASASKIKIFFGRIGNKIAHSKEKREAYKKMTPEERAAAKAEEKQKKKELKETKMQKVSYGGKNKFKNIDKKKKNLITLGLIVFLWIIGLLLLCLSNK